MKLNVTISDLPNMIRESLAQTMLAEAVVFATPTNDGLKYVTLAAELVLNRMANGAAQRLVLAMDDDRDGGGMSSLALDADLAARIDEIAERRGLTPSALLDIAISRALDHDGAPR